MFCILNGLYTFHQWKIDSKLKLVWFTDWFWILRDSLVYWNHKVHNNIKHLSSRDTKLSLGLNTIISISSIDERVEETVDIPSFWAPFINIFSLVVLEKQKFRDLVLLSFLACNIFHLCIKNINQSVKMGGGQEVGNISTTVAGKYLFLAIEAENESFKTWSTSRNLVRFMHL